MSRLAQLVERKTLNLVVVGSSPTVGVTLFGALSFLYFFRRGKKKKIQNDFPRPGIEPGSGG